MTYSDKKRDKGQGKQISNRNILFNFNYFFS